MADNDENELDSAALWRQIYEADGGISDEDWASRRVITAGIGETWLLKLGGICDNEVHQWVLMMLTAFVVHHLEVTPLTTSQKLALVSAVLFAAHNSVALNFADDDDDDEDDSDATLASAHEQERSEEDEVRAWKKLLGSRPDLLN